MTDSLEIILRKGPASPDVLIELSNLHYISVSKPPEISGCFIDAISLIHLPKTPRPWPGDAAGRVRRCDGLPELAWLRVLGPTEADVMASIVTVCTAVSDDKASTDTTR
ncbi:hypothetical protein [Streptomyces mirabilis]|uniref:hypothetical protein n=1 Tax=Streptomyces mirabilis TaxID=68239 RepID=UPI000EB55970|nr:hypothetical protein [Streptomyces mirabilis]